MATVDNAFALKLLAGTLARGILWVAAALAAKYGVETVSEDTALGLAGFAAALIVTGVSAWWSARKDGKLLATPPPQ